MCLCVRSGLRRCSSSDASMWSTADLLQAFVDDVLQEADAAESSRAEDGPDASRPPPLCDSDMIVPLPPQPPATPSDTESDADLDTDGDTGVVDGLPATAGPRGDQDACEPPLARGGDSTHVAVAAADAVQMTDVVHATEHGAAVDAGARTHTGDEDEVEVTFRRRASAPDAGEGDAMLPGEAADGVTPLGKLVLN